MRKDHKRWDARSIRTQLIRAGVDPPAISTIHQALRRNHLVADQPKKRPKFNKRFERKVPNDLWQTDATKVKLVNRRQAWAMNALDDHARFLLSSVACEGPTGEAAITCFDPGGVSVKCHLLDKEFDQREALRAIQKWAEQVSDGLEGEAACLTLNLHKVHGESGKDGLGFGLERRRKLDSFERDQPAKNLMNELLQDLRQQLE